MNNIEKSTIFLVKCAIRDIKDQKFDFTEEELKGIYLFAEKHDIAHIVAYGLKINDALTDSDICKKFNDSIFKAYFRYQQTCATADKVYSVLEKADIDYMPLKGAVIRDLYPQPWMRTSSDIDILIRENDVEKAIASITDSSDFKSDLPSKYDVSLFSEKLHQHIELHFSLLDDRYEEMQKPLINIWNVTSKSGDDTHRYQLPNDYFLYYHYAHMAKHFKFMGFGIRLVLDTYLIKNKIHSNIDESNLFKIGNLVKFSNAINVLSEIWFGEQSSNSEFDDLSDYILGSGIYGTTENKVSNKNTSKFHYMLYRIFMPYDEMIYSYPILRKYKILLPLCWFLRFFKIFKKNKAKTSVKELKVNFSTNYSDKIKIRHMLEKYDLPQ